MRNLPIRLKLSLLLLIASSVTFTAICVVLVVNDSRAWRDETARNLGFLPALLSDQCRMAVAAQDRAQVEAALSVLADSPEVIAALVFLPDGKLLASFTRDQPATTELCDSCHRFTTNGSISMTTTKSPDQVLGDYHFAHEQLFLFETVRLDGAPIGLISVQLSLRSRGGRSIGWALSAALLSSLALTALLFRSLDRIVSRPLTELAAVARGISDQHDLTVRTRPRSEDEVGVLATQINLMLEQLERQENGVIKAGERIQDLIERLPPIVFEIDTESKLTYLNQTGLQLLGVSSAELAQGVDLSRVVVPEEYDHAADLFGQLLAGEPVEEHEITVLTADGGRLVMTVAASPIIFQGRRSGLRGAMTDVSSYKQVEAELLRAKDGAEKASRLKSVFLSNVSHEIRTPLNGIIGFAEIILASTSLDEMREQARTILRESEGLLALINDLLDHAKIESGGMELERQPFNLRVLMARVVSTAQVQARRKELELGVIVEDEVPQYVVGDALRIRQVLVNLVGSAIRFNKDGSIKVRVEQVKCSDGSVRLKFWVSDTGTGIDKKKQLAVLESLVGEGQVTRRYDESGLATTISRQLVQLMGGEIGLLSEPGKGTSFWFWIPLEIAAGPPEAADLAGIYEKSLKTGLILLAEDYPPNQKVACKHLESVGHVVEVAENGVEAVAACKEQFFDLILMDIQMPEMDGFEATRLIRSGETLCTESPILGLTAHADIEANHACQEAGMNDVVTKPIRRRTFLAVVDRWLSYPEAVPVETLLPATLPEQPVSSATPLPDPDEANPIDLDLVVSELNGDKALTRAAVKAFMQDVERQLASLHETLESQSAEALNRQAHAIRSCAEKLTAFPLAAAAERMESICESKKLGEASSALSEIEKRFRRLQEYVASSHLGTAG
jgi:PAS domain S-box-containing protein